MSREVLENTGLTPEINQLVMDQLGKGPGDLRLVVGNFGGEGSATAIRNEDLQLLRVSATLVGGFFAAAAFIGWAPVAVAGLVILIFEYRKKRINLSTPQAAILRELKAHPGLTAEQLASGLQIQGISTDVIQSELKALSEMRRADYVVVSLVNVDSAGRWFPQDV
jgi:hypothetical protein